MANILTAAEAATVLRCEATDPNLLALLPLVDAYVKNATGRDWAADSPVAAEAKAAARILMVRAHEDPGALSQPVSSLGWGLTACLVQLEAIALHYRTFEGTSGPGSIYLPGVKAGDSVRSLVGKVGVTGDQSAAFESVITLDGYIKQVSTADLSGKWFTAHLVSPEEL